MQGCLSAANRPSPYGLASWADKQKTGLPRRHAREKYSLPFSSFICPDNRWGFERDESLNVRSDHSDQRIERFKLRFLLFWRFVFSSLPFFSFFAVPVVFFPLRLTCFCIRRNRRKISFFVLWYSFSHITLLLSSIIYNLCSSELICFPRQWEAKFAWFSANWRKKFCRPLVNFSAGKNSRVEKVYQRALLHFNLHINPRRQIQIRKRVYNLRIRIQNINKAFVDPDFILLPRIFVDKT